MRILFLGNDYNRLSVACLSALVDDATFHLTVGVHVPQQSGARKTVIRSLKSHGARFVASRSVDLAVANVRRLARTLGVPLVGYRSLREVIAATRVDGFTCGNVNSRDTLNRIMAARPDLIVVAGFSQILKPDVISAPALGCINLHPSLLPKYRGPNPFYWVLENGETTTGVTILHVDEGIDSGDIILQRQFPVRPGETERSLLSRSADIATGLLIQATHQLAAGSAKRRPQNHDEATYFGLPPRGASTL